MDHNQPNLLSISINQQPQHQSTQLTSTNTQLQQQKSNKYNNYIYTSQIFKKMKLQARFTWPVQRLPPAPTRRQTYATWPAHGTIVASTKPKLLTGVWSPASDPRLTRTSSSLDSASRPSPTRRRAVAHHDKLAGTTIELRWQGRRPAPQRSPEKNWKWTPQIEQRRWRIEDN